MPQIGDRKTVGNSVFEYDGTGWKQATSLTPQSAQGGGDKPALGDRKTFGDTVAQWDGSGWKKINHGASGGWNETSLGADDALIGAAKGVANTGYGLLNIPGITDKPKPEFLAPKGPGQNLFYNMEQGAEYMIPIPGLGAAKLPTQMLAEGARNYATSAAHGDANPGMMGAIGAASPVVARGITATGKWLSDYLPESVMRTLVKPGTKEVPVHMPYDRPGTNAMDEVAGMKANKWEDFANQVNTKVNDLGRQLDAELQRASSQGMQVDVVTPIAAAMTKPEQAALGRGQGALVAKMNEVSDYWMKKALAASNGTGQLTPWDATLLKRELKLSIDDFSDPSEASVKKVLQNMYNGIDKAVDVAAPRAGELNQRYSNAITMQQQIQARAAGSRKGEEVSAWPWRNLLKPFYSVWGQTHIAGLSQPIGEALQATAKIPARGVFGMMSASTQQQADEERKKRGERR